MASEIIGKVLIVANSAENLMEYNLCLENRFEIRNSPTLDSTLDLLDDFEPDVVVIDENISNSSALEISEAIRSDNVSNSYTGIVVIADKENHNLDQLRHSCVADFVTPRVTAKQMLEMFVCSAHRIKALENKSKALISKLAMTKETVKELEGLDSIKIPPLSKVFSVQ